MSIEEWRAWRAQHWVLAHHEGLTPVQQRLFRRWMQDPLNGRREYRRTKWLWDVLDHVPRQH